MGALAVLAEMHGLVKAQVEAVVAGDHEAVLAGALRHEELLRVLETAEVDGTPEELKAAVDAMELDKSKLQSLLSSETVRVDFLLRLILGGGTPKAGGYPNGFGRQGGPSSRLNKRT